jgi:hypothetical protein
VANAADPNQEHEGKQNDQRADAKPGREQEQRTVAPAGIGSSLACGLTMTARDGIE